MFWKPTDWPWPLDNAVQASLLGELLAQEGIPCKVVRHGEALWGYAENVAEGWGHLETPEEFTERVEELYRAFLASEAGNPEDVEGPEL